MKYTVGLYAQGPETFTFRFKDSPEHHLIPEEFCRECKTAAAAFNKWLNSQYNATSIAIPDQWQEVMFNDTDQHLMFLLRWM